MVFSEVLACLQSGLFLGIQQLYIQLYLTKLLLIIKHGCRFFDNFYIYSCIFWELQKFIIFQLLITLKSYVYMYILLCSWIIVCPKGLYVNRWSPGGFWKVDGTFKNWNQQTFKRSVGHQKHSTDLRAFAYSSFLLLCHVHTP